MRGTGRIRHRLRKAVYGNVVLVGVLSLVWLLLRSGRKPSRITYPCQRAAMANTVLLFGGVSVPLAARLPGIFTGRPQSARTRMIVRGCEAAAALALAVLVVLSLTGVLGGSPPGPKRSMDEMRAAAAGLALPALRSAYQDASKIYVAEGIPPTSELGVDTLIDVMDANGLDFFRSGSSGKAAGAAGLIGSNDVVMIKVNGEWRWRGGTNTDVVKGLINAITHHPDGFTGEVVIVENGQWDSYMDNLPNNRNPSSCNAQDVTQSFNDVALMYAGGHKVSVYDWTQVQTRAVNEFSRGDFRDGYVYMPSIEEGYPKFTTVYGTRISMRDGVWEGTRYDSARLKFLNVPVLKDHGGAGVTCAVKHFMGVQDLWKMTQDPPHEPMRTEGIFGKVMLEARYPDLNIADAIWVTPAGGPNGPYDKAVRLDRLVASQDPIALDYYCGRYVLMPVSGNPRHDPNNPNTAGGENFFHQMLTSTCKVLAAGGKNVTMDESRMSVFREAAPQQLPRTTYETWLAEGCTGYGFETWVLVSNPHDTAANVYVSYITEQGVRNREPVRVPAHSRLTINANADVWQQSAGVRVGSDLTVYVERAVYWNDRADGHDSIGTPSGASDWYLAEGCTDYGFETWVEILNPGAVPANVSVTYLTASGAVAGPTLTVPPWSRQTVNVNATAPRGDVAIKVSADRSVVAERSMYWDARRGGSGSIGARQLSTDWYLAEGATHSGFDTYLLVANPQDRDATVTVDLMPGKSGTGRTIKVAVPAMSRRTIRANDVLPGADVSFHVHSTLPVVAERSMYWDTPTGKAGHASIGLTAPGKKTFLPEGCTAYGFDTWLLMQNPGTADAKATVYAMTGGGEREVGDFKVAAGRRKTVHLNDYYDGDLSIRVDSTEPVVCERSMYWNARGGGTCSIGYTR